MMRIAISAHALDAIAETLPFGSNMYEAKTPIDGALLLVERRALNQLHARTSGAKTCPILFFGPPRSRHRGPAGGGGGRHDHASARGRFGRASPCVSQPSPVRHPALATIRIAVTAAAFDAVAATLPLGSVAYDADAIGRTPP
jgi:hypothetical protein